ncbi:transposase [Kitasatospora sp. NPDC089509]|uniref:transposase n=1 Tax=Kitasatospora sp. NPDC089509 TaxID=3364079 RepID=UPI00382C2B2C
MGRTPVVHVRGRGSGWVSVAGTACYKKGERSRLIHKFRFHRGRKGEPKAFSRQDYRDLIVRARTQLGGPIVLVRDNLSAHLMPQMKEFIAASADWLTVFQLTLCAADLNPREGIWALMKRGIGNLAVVNVDHLAKAVKRHLKKIQYRPHLIESCLTSAGLNMDD